MTTYHVLAFPCHNSDSLIATEVFNPLPGQILKSFKVPEPSIPFDPLHPFNGHADELSKLRSETYQKAVDYLKAITNP